MQIHIVKHDEKLFQIASYYGVSEENLRRVNEIKVGEPTEGEELLILIPTRSYRVQYGDSAERIALRFGIRKRDIYTLNPWICGEKLNVGDDLTLKYDERKHGMKVANGYFYKGCEIEDLLKVLPYLTYVTFSSALADDRGIKRILSDFQAVDLANKEGKISLVRVQDNYTNRFRENKNHAEFAEELIQFAKEGNYKGILLNSSAFSNVI